MPGRDERGRWKKGTSGNPKGRPRRKSEEKVLDWFSEECTEDDVKAWYKTMCARARAGDVSAFKAIMSYLAGLPTQYIKADVDAEVKKRVIGLKPRKKRKDGD